MYLRKKHKKRLIIGSLQVFGKLLEQNQTIDIATKNVIYFVTTMFPNRGWPVKLMFLEKYRFLNDFWYDVLQFIAAGSRLSFCLEKYSLVDPAIVERIAKAEEDGNLPTVLANIDADDADLLTSESADLFDDLGLPLLVEYERPVVELCNRILVDAYVLGADQVAIDYVPDGFVESAEDKELAELDRMIEELEIEEGGRVSPSHVSIYFYEKGKWVLHSRCPWQYRQGMKGRFLFMAEIPYWTKSDAEGKAAFKKLGWEGVRNIKVHYYPEDERVLLDLSGP
jgi:hypothetical protein